MKILYDAFRLLSILCCILWWLFCIVIFPFVLFLAFAFSFSYEGFKDNIYDIYVRPFEAIKYTIKNFN
jgi:hypothetical protein